MPGAVFPAFLKIEHTRDGSAKSSFLAEVDSTLGAAERRFKEFSSQAQQQVDAALSVKRNSFGSLDLGVDQLKASAAAQQARAIAAREVAVATAFAAKAEGDYSQKARLAVAATQALAIEEEQAAAKALSHASAAEQVQAALNRQKSATDAVVAATRRGTDVNGAVTNSTRAHRTAMIQLGQQLQDMTVQWQGGANAMLIFGQQVPQAAFALSGLGGKIGSVASFLAGPWGAAIFVAIAALGPFVSKLIEAEDETTKAERAQRSFAEVLNDSTSSYKEVTAAAKAYADQQERARTTTLEQIQIEATATAGRLKSAIAIRQQLDAELERYNFGVTHAGGVGGIIGTNSALAISGIDARRAENAKALQVLQKDSTEVVIKAADAIAKIQSDPAERIKVGFDTLRQSARSTIKDVITLTARLADLDRQQTAAEKALKPGAANGARDLAAFGSPAPGARITSGYGARERPTAGASTNHLGIDYAVPIGTPVLAAMDGIVKFASMVKGYGNQIELNHGAGTASRYSHLSRFNVTDGQEVSKGDVIGYSGKTGVATGPHLHYEVLVNGKKVDPGKGNFPVDATRVAQQGEQARAAAQRTADALQAMGERSAESIARINERFDKQPKLIDAAAQAARQLQDIIIAMSDTTKARPANFQKLIDDAEAAKLVIQEGLLRPFEDLQKASERRIALAELTTAGREAEANAMQDIWRLEDQIGTEEELRAKVTALIAEGRNAEADALQLILSKYPALMQGIKDQAQHEYAINEALKARQAITDAYLNATRSIRGELESLFSGDGADFGKIFKRLQAQLTVEKLFGDSLRKLEQTIKTGGLQTSVDTLATETDRGSEAVKTFADAMIEQSDRIRTGAPGTATLGASGSDDAALNSLTAAFDRALSKPRAAAAANDNGAGSYDPATGEITVNGSKASVGAIAKPDRNTVGGTTLTAYSEMVGSVMTKPLIDAISSISPELAAKLGPMLNGAIGGLMTGGIPGAVLGGLKELPGISKGLSKALGKGLEGAQTGSMVAGISKSLGIKMSNTGAQIGGAIGSFIPIPGGSLIGSVVGGLLGNLFKKVQSGYAQIRPSGDTAAVTGTYGRTGDLQANATKAANSLLDTLRTLAERVGGTLGGFDLDVGTKDEKFVVTSSRGGTQSFATEEEAIRYAIRNAISGGAIKGVREGTQRILQAGSDIETQLQKAMDFESVFKRLRAQTDPVGAAIDAVDTEFKRLQNIFKEAGASTAEYADLEKLYGIERTKAVKDAASQMTGALKGLLDDLTIGDNGLSLSDRRANAMAKYQPLAAQVKAGDVSAYDDFAAAARSLIDISREMYGSQNPYFELFNEVKGITQGALDASTAIANQSAGSASIFAGATASNDNSSVVSAISGMNSDLVNQLTAANINLGILIKQGLGSGDLQSLAQYVGPMWQPQGYF